MSLLVSSISKLLLRKKPFSSRFSTRSSTATTSRSKPYLLLDPRNFKIYDPFTNKEKEVDANLKIQEQSQTYVNFMPIGSSRGYLAISNIKESSIDLLEIDSQMKKRKIISLPQLHFDYEDDPNVRSVSVSSPVNGGDVIVAVKFYGSRLSLCRVGDSEWTEIDVPFDSFEYSSVIYSERNERFYLNNDDPDCTDPIDLTPKSGLGTPPVIGYPFPISSEPEPEEYEKFLNCGAAFSHVGSQDQIVESPSGQLFLVSWTNNWIYKTGEMENEKATHMIVVYKQDEEEGGEICSYKMTKDIGDLCIFMGENEAFCVSASDYPGLEPNSVYFACPLTGVGVWDLSSQTTLYFRLESLFQDQPAPLTMCWIPPTTTTTS